MDERRQAERHEVVDLQLFGQATGDLLGKVVNISEGGLLVLSETEFKPGERDNFYIPFTQTVQGMVKFEFLGEIRWVQPESDNSSLNKVGMAFALNPDVQTLFIQQLVKIYGPS